MKTRTILKFQKLFTLVLIFAFIQTGFAQSATPKTPAEAEADFKKEVVVFLRETASEVGSLRSPENRISFTAELAALMWFNDEKESRTMYLSVISDFKQLLGQYDAQLNMIESSPEAGGDFGGGSFIFGDDSEKGKLSRKLRMAMTVRQEIANSMAEHDPQMAFDFFYDSLSAITNVDRRKEYEAQDKYLETKLLNEIAEHNAAKAAELGRKSLAKEGVNFQHLDLLKKIYAKDADKGAEFGDDITRRLKDLSGGEENIYLLSSALRAGIPNFESVKKEGGKKPMFSEQNLRDLSEILARRLLESTPEADLAPMSYVDAVEKFAPSRAVQIRAKYGKGTGDGTGMGVGRGNVMVTTVSLPPPSSANSNVNTSSRGTSYGTNQPRPDKDAAAAELKRKAEEQLMKDVENLGTRQLPKEERDKIVAQARKIVSEMGSKDQKIMALSMLAAQVAKAGDKDLAGEIMKDTAAMVNPQPKNYKDFILVWMLASGYAEADPDKAFPLLDDAIFRLNDTITGVVKIAEFLDVAGEIVDDGEVQVGAFGGSMMREITRGLGVVDGTLRSLAKADLVKTKAMTNRFDRPEVRVLAKMLVLRAVMGEKKPTADTTLPDPEIED